MRLIDVDDFKVFLQSLIDAGAEYNGFIELLERQPNIYDVERIIEQLKHNYLDIGRLIQIIENMEAQIKIMKLMTEECIKTETGLQSSQRKFDSILDFASYMNGLSQALLSSLTYYKKNITHKTVEDMIDQYKVSK